MWRNAFTQVQFYWGTFILLGVISFVVGVISLGINYPTNNPLSLTPGFSRTSFTIGLTILVGIFSLAVTAPPSERSAIENSLKLLAWIGGGLVVIGLIGSGVMLLILRIDILPNSLSFIGVGFSLLMVGLSLFIRSKIVTSQWKK
jgi:hypothetical protein